IRATPDATQNGRMSLPEHPSLSLPVTEADRDRAEEALKDAYCTGRLDEVEFDRRLDLVLRARTRRDLNATFDGLPPAPRRPSGTAQTAGSGIGAVAHLSALFTWILGPLLVYGASAPGSPGRREAAKAFNFQLIMAIVLVLTVLLGAIPLVPDVLVGALVTAGWLSWLVLTIVGGARALSGQPWQNPVMKVLRLEVLDSRTR
ncbi:MAG: DUF1707 and DUF4870 domain-containing protein, partial [Actinomycetes bacterium]